MKLILPFVIAVLGFSTSIVRAQEQPLIAWPTQDGQNVQVGQLALPLSVQGINIRDTSSGNLTASIPLLTDLTSVATTIQIGDTLYALIPPDGSNQATAVILYRAASSTDDEVNRAVQDALNHNNWFNVTPPTPQTIAPSGETFPAGTQFWVCSSTGFVTFTASGGIFLAGPLPPPVDPNDPAVSGLQALMNSTSTQ